jgi:hypothetical protein
VQELTLRLIDSLLKTKAFPTLADMLMLDEFGRQNPGQLGAVLAEFPVAVQQTVFGMSSNDIWLEAFHRPASLELKCLELLNTMSHNVRDEKSMAWETLLINIWRLDDQLPDYVRWMDAEQAFTVLSDLPKSMSIHVARSVFPGNWARLLDAQFRRATIGPEEIVRLSEMALRTKPLREFSVIKAYKKDLELIAYLDKASTSEEREIYVIAAPDSLIRKLRRPFYPLFEQKPEMIRELMGLISMDHWQLALFNVTHNERRIVVQNLTEKQRYLFVQKMKQFDNNPPDAAAVAAARNHIANVLYNLMNKKLVEEVPPPAEANDGPVQENHEAA